MNLLLVADGHYYQTPDGKVYSDSVFDYTFYKRYLSVFEHVYTVIRAKQVIDIPVGKKLASGDGISFILLPNYHGPYQYLLKYIKIRRQVEKICNDKNIDCAIFRIPAATANIVAYRFLKTRKPFAVEVVTDPWANFGPFANGNKIMLWFVRRNWTQTVKLLCLKADGASYVTKNYLQTLYPPKSDVQGYGFTSSYSSVELSEEGFGKPRIWNDSQKSFCISHAANYFSSYGKGHLTVMDAVKKVRNEGFDINIKFIGDGPKRKEFESYAKKIGISEYVNFIGRLSNGEEVRKAIANSDIFILPTYAEGLPRVLLEAMSVGLPCLSSPVCGIPEILSNEYLYDFSDSNGFAEGIINLITSTNKLAKASETNINTALGFSSTVLNNKRDRFYKELRKLVEEKC